MPSVISSSGQTRWKNSYATSPEAKLTLRVNGEEDGTVITPQGALVPAGFPAPTAAAVVTSGGGGTVAEGYYVWRYCYASSRYPFVANDVTADGEEWPRSSPSPSSNTFQVTGGAKQLSVLVTYTTRSDVDWILIYRTSVQTTAALAEAQDDAGRLFFVGSVANNTAGGTVTYTDNDVTDTGEAMDLDNYECPLFRYTVFDGFYWWGFGNTTLTAAVTLDGTNTFSINTGVSAVDAWFSGRDGYTISFVGITTGGYDGRGNYYFKRATSPTGQAFAGSDLVTPAVIPATGTTTAYLTAPATTLYRSKRLNPFSWGRTTELTDSILFPELWAERIGGGTGTGISLIPNERILKLDTEGPQKSYALDLNAASNSDFLGTLRTLDEAQSTSSHFSQFPMRDANGQTTLASVNAKAFQFLSADGQSQIPIGDNVIETLGRMQNDGTNPDFFHGVFDYRTELNCWFIKTTDADVICDTLIYQHSPTGKWGKKYVPISASASIYDEVTRDHMTFVGDEYGRLGILFASDVYSDWLMDEDETSATWLANYGESGAFTIPSIGEATMVVDGAGGGTGLTGLGLTSGGQYLVAAPMGGGSLLRIVVTSGAAGTFRYYDVDWGSGSFDVGVITDFIGIPTVVVDADIERRYLMLRWDALAVSAADDGVVVLSIPETGQYGVNLDTGIYEQVESPSIAESSETMTVAIGPTLCTLRRSFIVGPDRDKRIAESWISMENPGTTYLRYFYEYGETMLGAKVPVRDATDSCAYFVREPPAKLMRSFTVDIHDVGYTEFRILDFTHKVQKA